MKCGDTILAEPDDRSLLHATNRRTPGGEPHRVVDRPADAAPTANPPRGTSGRSLIRHTSLLAATAG